MDSPMRRPGASPSRTDSVEGGSPGPRCGAQAAGDAGDASYAAKKLACEGGGGAGPSTLSMWAAVIGTILEFYDFSVFAFFAPEIGRLFFPHGDATLRAVQAFSVFAGGFVMRPLGSVFLGACGFAEPSGRFVEPPSTGAGAWPAAPSGPAAAWAPSSDAPPPPSSIAGSPSRSCWRGAGAAPSWPGRCWGWSASSSARTPEHTPPAGSSARACAPTARSFAR